MREPEIDLDLLDEVLLRRGLRRFEGAGRAYDFRIVRGVEAGSWLLAVLQSFEATEGRAASGFQLLEPSLLLLSSR